MSPAQMLPYSVVTVVFPPEWPLLQVQARSIARYASPEDFAQIIIIVNDSVAVQSEERESLLSLYGSHAKNVLILTRDQVCPIRRASGWDSQQILKLAASQLVETERYIVLDAKTHLVSPLQRSFLEASDGRALANCVDYRSNELRYAMERAGRSFMQMPADYLENGLDSVTPFIFYTKYVKLLIEEVKTAFQLPFPDAFLMGGFTEFTLYSAWLRHKGFDLTKLYDFHQAFTPVIWGSSGEPDYCRSKIKDSLTSKSPFFSVHRRAIGQMPEESIAIVGRFWAERGLTRNQEEAEHLLRLAKSAVLKSSFSERARDRVLKLIYLTRRLRARFKRWSPAGTGGRDVRQGKGI